MPLICVRVVAGGRSRSMHLDGGVLSLGMDLPELDLRTVYVRENGMLLTSSYLLDI